MFWAYLYIAAWVIFVVLVFWFGIEFWLGPVGRAAPKIPSSRGLRDAVVKEIQKHYPDAKMVLDIGSCYGGMARMVARVLPNAHVIGVEKMLGAFMVSKILRIFWQERNVNFVRADFFKFIEKQARGKNAPMFDIGVAYLLTSMMDRVEAVADDFRVMLVLDFPLPNRKPTRKYKLHKDFLGQHWLYVYENKKIK